ncbi:MAG: 6-phosphogluconolactonase [Rhizobiales bacterium]|nr:6-phosphogluconolactonase [Hyphomicrobiales bacterium]MBI3672748.1 6-phosphogluconolactonase [Hyphomicrobiales bacterium]
MAAERLFADRERLAWHLASDVAGALRRTIAEKGKATLAVSGGATPRLFLEKLSQMGIPWPQVTATLVDERQVSEDSERSNARLVRTSLIQNKAAAARFAPLYENPSAADVLPLDVVVLGMGNDGHTASFFPGGDRLAEALDPAAAPAVIEMIAPGAGEPRLTFNLSALQSASVLMLHIEGPEKRKTLERALGEGPVSEMPVRAVLRSHIPLTLYWCR